MLLNNLVIGVEVGWNVSDTQNCGSVESAPHTRQTFFYLPLHLLGELLRLVVPAS
jgi:hypothetical protein